MEREPNSDPGPFLVSMRHTSVIVAYAGLTFN
jgi:hypothetical protein